MNFNRCSVRCREFYENDAFLADQVYGPSLVWLLGMYDFLS